MLPNTQPPNPPSDDKRWRVIGRTMRQHGYKPNALIETLHTVQETFGYLDETAFKFVAQSLRVPLSRVYGVATFYHFFNLTPPGEHTCVVCTGTACFIKGANDILDTLQQKLGIKAGETTPDGKMTVYPARCVGACGLAPVVIFDGKFAGKLDSESVMKKVRELTEDATG